jgi:8-oxo-dGTP pyrophosphatase MutT (NUDIX family)
MKPTSSQPATQYAAVCYRHTAPGACEVLLITSLDTGRWVLPKGWPKKGETGGDSAMREAYEEAGVVGRLREGCLGVYGYDKILASDLARPCCVAVHVIAVSHLDFAFPEKGLRTREWFAPDIAAGLVDEPELKRLLESFSPEA